jgi:hypothetical protein
MVLRRYLLTHFPHDVAVIVAVTTALLPTYSNDGTPFDLYKTYQTDMDELICECNSLSDFFFHVLSDCCDDSTTIINNHHHHRKGLHQQTQSRTKQ